MHFNPQSTQDPQGLIYLSALFIEHLRVKHFSKRTLYTRSRELSRFRQFCQDLGITQARQVTRAVILNYQSYLFHYRKHDKSPLTVGTQKHWVGAVCTFFSYLTREGHVPYNPASDIEMPRKQMRLPKVILSATEVEAILNVPDVATPLGIRDRAMLEVLYSTGIRRMELCNLQRGHIDFERELVQVEQGKGAKDRFVPISQRALKWVEKYLVEVRPRLCPALSEETLFLNTEGAPLSESRLGMVVRQILVTSGIGKAGGCHLFRHAFATVLLQNGCDLRHIQLMLGHASVETTQIYTHVAIRELQEAHRRCHPACKSL